MTGFGTPLPPDQAPAHRPEPSAPPGNVGHPLAPDEAPARRPAIPVGPGTPGQPISPGQAPAKIAHPPVPSTSGQPLQQPPPNQPITGRNLQAITLFGGADGFRIPQNLPPGVGHQIINFMPTDRGLVPRLGLSAVSVSHYSNGGLGVLATVIGQMQNVSLAPTTYVVGLSTKSGALLHNEGGASWITALGAPSSFSLGGGALYGIWDAAQAYDPVADTNVLILAQSGTTAAVAQIYGSAGTISALTNSAFAATVCYFDTRVMFGAVTDQPSSSVIPQRVVWSARGDLNTYTAPDGGTQDLVDMKGYITKLLPELGRVVIFSEYEIWQAVSAPFPFGFIFTRMIPGLGCREPRTIASVPQGTIFLGHDQVPYLLPLGASQVVPLDGSGQLAFYVRQRRYPAAPSSPAWTLAITDTTPGLRSFAAYDARYNEYQLFIQTPDMSRGFSRTALCYNLGTQAVSVRSFGALRGATLHEYTAAAYLAAEGNAGATNYDPIGAVLYLGSDTSLFQQKASVATTGGAYSSGDTNDAGSNFSATALFPIPNPNPNEKLTVRALNLDYSTNSMPSGASVTVAFSSDFGQTYSSYSIALALPYQQYSGNTVVPVNWPAATYPSVEFRYTSQVSGNLLTIQRAQAVVEGVGLGWP